MKNVAPCSDASRQKVPAAKRPSAGRMTTDPAASGASMPAQREEKLFAQSASLALPDARQKLASRSQQSRLLCSMPARGKTHNTIQQTWGAKIVTAMGLCPVALIFALTTARPCASTVS